MPYVSVQQRQAPLENYPAPLEHDHEASLPVPAVCCIAWFGARGQQSVAKNLTIRAAHQPPPPGARPAKLDKQLGGQAGRLDDDGHCLAAGYSPRTLAQFPTLEQQPGSCRANNST